MYAVGLCAFVHVLRVVALASKRTTAHGAVVVTTTTAHGAVVTAESCLSSFVAAAVKNYVVVGDFLLDKFTDICYHLSIMIKNLDDMLTIKEASALVGVSRQTIYAWMNDGILGYDQKGYMRLVHRKAITFVAEATLKQKVKGQPRRSEIISRKARNNSN